MQQASSPRGNPSRSSSGEGQRSGVERKTARVELQLVPAGKVLFQPGDERQVFRVESGAISHFMHWSDGRHEVIEFAFPGDVIGIGHLNTHVSRAHAMVDTLVSVITARDLDHVHKTDDVVALQLAAVGEREFDYLRDKALSGTKTEPVVRMAQYLIAIMRMNDDGGRSPDFVSDENCSPFIAEMLNMNSATMGAALLRLQEKGLIAATNGGLRILDCGALEQFADGA